MGTTLNKVASDVQCLAVYMTNEAIGCLTRDEKKRYWLKVNSEEFKNHSTPTVKVIGERLAKNLPALLNNKDGSPNEGARNFMKNQRIIIEREAIVIPGPVHFRVPINQ